MEMRRKYFNTVTWFDIVIVLISGLCVFLVSQFIFSVYFGSENKRILFLVLGSLVGIEGLGYFLMRRPMIHDLSPRIHRVLGAVFGCGFVILVLILGLLIFS